MRRNIRVVLAAFALAAVPVIPAVWPARWSANWQLAAVVPLTIISVVLIELERRAGRDATHAEAALAGGGLAGGGHAGHHGVGPAGRDGVGPARRRGEPKPAADRRPAGSRGAEPAGVATEQPVPSGQLLPKRPEPIPPQGTFRGRQAELSSLIATYHAARNRATGGTGGRPILLLIHGKPGVGKSALAKELARRLSPSHPDGQYYANLGNAGDALSPGEVLRILIDQVGWDEPVSPDPAERAKLLRALTAEQRALFIFDAARDHEQVLDVMPTGADCTVIVTSRRDLSAGLRVTSWLLTEPTTDEALDILHAVAETDDYEAPLCAAAVVHRCGCLPLAIQAAGERISQEKADICNVASFLKPPDLRLERLTRRGRSFAHGIATEYRLLNDVEREAFRLLSKVPCTSFAPWLLAPLLDVPVSAAETIMARLAGSQLLDPAGGDGLSGFARYQLHPLVRLFAQREMTRDAAHGQVLPAARYRLRLTYRWLLAELFKQREPGFELSHPVDQPPGLVPGSELPVELARHVQPWIRAEHHNLVGCVRDLYDDEEWGLCWRVAVWLGGCFPEEAEVDATVEVFDTAVLAAQWDKSPAGRTDVLLAKGAYLTAAERYSAAHRALADAQKSARQWSTEVPAESSRAQLRIAQADLRMGEGYVQMRRPREAEAHLQTAHRRLAELGCDDELRLVRILEDINHDIDTFMQPDELYQIASDNHRFWAMVELAEERRRRRDWEEAARHLEHALTCCTSDGRRVANVRYRHARLLLERHADGGADRDHIGRQAVRRAAEALLAFQRMENPVGAVRARCLLVRILACTGHQTSAEEHLLIARRHLDQLGPEAEVAVEPLRARLAWAQGIVLRHGGGSATEVRDALFAAAQIFHDLGDARSRSAVIRLIDTAVPDNGATGDFAAPTAAVAVDGSSPAAPARGEQPDPARTIPAARRGIDSDPATAH